MHAFDGDEVQEIPCSLANEIGAYTKGNRKAIAPVGKHAFFKEGMILFNQPSRLVCKVKKIRT